LNNYSVSFKVNKQSLLDGVATKINFSVLLVGVNIEDREPMESYYWVTIKVNEENEEKAVKAAIKSIEELLSSRQCSKRNAGNR